MISVELDAEPGIYVAIQKRRVTVQDTQRQQKSIVCLILGHPGTACLAGFKENSFVIFSLSYGGFLSFADKFGVFFLKTHQK